MAGLGTTSLGTAGLGTTGLGTAGLGTTGLGTTGYDGRRASAIHQVNKCTACYLQWRPYRLDIYGNSHDNDMLLQE